MDFDKLNKFFCDCLDNCEQDVTPSCTEYDPTGEVIHVVYKWLHTIKQRESYHVYTAWFAIRVLLLHTFDPIEFDDLLAEMDENPEVFAKSFDDEYDFYRDIQAIKKQLNRILTTTNMLQKKLDFLNGEEGFERYELSYGILEDEQDTLYDDSDDSDSMIDLDCGQQYRSTIVRRLIKAFNTPATKKQTNDLYYVDSREGKLYTANVLIDDENQLEHAADVINNLLESTFDGCVHLSVEEADEIDGVIDILNKIKYRLCY